MTVTSVQIVLKIGRRIHYLCQMPQSPKIIAIIPSRYGSTRLPGKPLIELQGKTMIQRVYEIASQVYDDVFVATDDDRIFNTVQSFGGKVIMTANTHKDGTSRVLEAYEKCGVNADYIVNVQGDEPIINPEMLKQVNQACEHGPDIATLISPVTKKSELYSASEVFVVTNDKDEALYFSRSIIPAIKGQPRAMWFDQHTYYKHVGIYAYNADKLHELVHLPHSSYAELEGLEQLTWLQHGYSVKTAETTFESISIDMPEDVEVVRAILAEREG